MAPVPGSVPKGMYGNISLRTLSVRLPPASQQLGLDEEDKVVTQRIKSGRNSMTEADRQLRRDAEALTELTGRCIGQYYDLRQKKLLSDVEDDTDSLSSDVSYEFPLR